MWVAEADGARWLEAATPERAWYRDALADPVVALEHGGATARYRAVPEPGPEGHRRIRALLRAKYGWADDFVGLCRTRRARSPCRPLEPLAAGLTLPRGPDPRRRPRRPTRRQLTLPARRCPRSSRCRRAPARQLPGLGAGLGLLRDPTAFFARARARLGDTFGVDVFGYRLFFVFSPEGVRRSTRSPREASFGLATFKLVFKHKIPLELAVGRRNRPHDLFGNQEVEGYLDEPRARGRARARGARAAGRFEAFAWARRLGHRLGLGCWAGAEAASPRYLDRLDPALRPARHRRTRSCARARRVRDAPRGKRSERRAMRGIEAVIGEILARARAQRARGRATSSTRSWRLGRRAGRRRASVQVARDVMLIHMGAQSNLYAALAWTLVNLLLHPDVLARVAAGDDDLLERCAHESIRLAQRSLTLRQVLRPLEVDDGRARPTGSRPACSCRDDALA